MKIELDLSKSMSNYEWDNEEELKDFIDNYMLKTLWELYNKNDLEHNENNLSEEEQNKLYDILDMFRKYEVKEL